MVVSRMYTKRMGHKQTTLSMIGDYVLRFQYFTYFIACSLHWHYYLLNYFIYSASERIISNQQDAAHIHHHIDVIPPNTPHDLILQIQDLKSIFYSLYIVLSYNLSF